MELPQNDHVRSLPYNHRLQSDVFKTLRATMLLPNRNRDHGQRHYLSRQTYKTDYVIHFVFKIQTILCCYYDL